MPIARTRPKGFWATATRLSKPVRIGIIGGGQLGQMLGFAARKLGIECRFVDPTENPPASACGKVIRGNFDDPVALVALADTCDVITYEFENVPVDSLLHIEGIAPVYPPAEALRHSQDRLDEKRLFEALDIPLPGYYAIDTRDDLDDAKEKLGLPMVIKTRRLGYDGKGQFVARKSSDLDTAWAELGGQALIAEQWVPFDYEVSCIGVRSVGGEVAIYPLSGNSHVDGILRVSKSPVDEPDLTEVASAYVRRLLDHLDYVGVLALELFVVGDELLANEFAPRVHNSGHWSIEGAETSQFENHLRAITDQPLGSTASTGHSGMVNLIGEIPSIALSPHTFHLHDYGKKPRPGRKLGHITVVTDSAAKRNQLIDEIQQSVTQCT
jgi:5-(carboxyamino)imidazole ribonucleotide synthase